MSYFLLGASALLFIFFLAIGAVGSSCEELGGKEVFEKHEIFSDNVGVIRIYPKFRCEGVGK